MGLISVEENKFKAQYVAIYDVLCYVKANLLQNNFFISNTSFNYIKHH